MTQIDVSTKKKKAKGGGCKSYLGDEFNLRLISVLPNMLSKFKPSDFSEPGSVLNHLKGTRVGVGKKDHTSFGSYFTEAEIIERMKKNGVLSRCYFNHMEKKHEVGLFFKACHLLWVEEVERRKI
jgi:hypothetical protein